MVWHGSSGAWRDDGSHQLHGGQQRRQGVALGAAAPGLWRPLGRQSWESRGVTPLWQGKAPTGPVGDAEHPLTIEQQNAFVHFLQSNPKYQHWSTLFAVLLGTGCRVAEFVGLRWCDVDFDRNVISINHNLIYRKHLDGKCYLSITTPKTKAGCRMIPMLPDVRKALLDERKRQAEFGIKCQTVVDGYTDFIFLNRFNETYHPPVINRAIKRISMEYNRMEMDKAEAEKREPVLLPPFSCHNLRHTFCTRLCENEPNIKVIQDIMGHADIQTTMNIYTDVQKEIKENCIQNLSSKIKVY